jgi:hypothetical protein
VRRRAACLLVLGLAATPAACGGDDSPEGGDGGAPAVFPEGGNVPEQRVTDLAPAARAARCELKDSSLTEAELPEGPNPLHTPTPDERVTYPDNPPTLGRHWPGGFQAQDGLYEEAPPDEALVHTMEHGRVIVWARPSLPRAARAALRALFEEDDYQMVLTPRADMPYAVAATAWNAEPGPYGTGRTLGCPEWSEEVVDAIRTFRDEHRSRGPEPVP